MIRLSVNVLTSAIALLKRLDTYHFSSLSEFAYSKIASISVGEIFEFSKVCGWVCEIQNTPCISQRGMSLLNLQDTGLLTELKRQMLMDYVLIVAPIWSNRIPYGRGEAVIFMTKDEKACFSEAGLLSVQLDDEMIAWWDTVASKIRAQAQQTKNDTGRLGERNTINYERKRTKFEPKWMSVDSNLVGYDIKSRLSEDDPEILLVEVKASTSKLSQASFHVTSREWSVASTSAAYVFHLWCLSGSKEMLAILSPNDIQPYIPTNNLDGEWESAKIPFSCFESAFTEIV
jgi:hypothetical protein